MDSTKTAVDSSCPDLPRSLEDALVEVLFGPATDREAGVARLREAHADHAAAIDLYVAIYERVEVGDATALPDWFADSEPAPTPMPERIGPYRVRRRLGGGAFGVVYLAERDEPKLRVAVKVLHAGRDVEQFLSRFRLEQQALAMMEHASIARFHGCGMTVDGRSWFAMEYVDGTPITRYCAERKLDIQQRVRLVLQVCAGVEHAHRKAIVHRDLKPSNVMVGTVDGMPEVKIIDFGLSRAMVSMPGSSEVVSQDGVFLGTPGYASPEQIESPETVDTRSDVYSLGVLLYELLTGSLPFVGERGRGRSLDEMAGLMALAPQRPSRRVRADTETLGAAGWDAGDASRIARRLRGDLDWVVIRALERDPARRYGSARELALDLERFLTHRPVSAGPPSVRYRLARFARRHRAKVAAGLAVAVAGSIGAVAYVQESQRARGAVAGLAAKVDEFDQLSHVVRLRDAKAQMADLGPPRPHRVAAMRAWLDTQARPLIAARPRIETSLAAMAGGGGAERFLEETLSRLVEEIDAFAVVDVPRVESALAWASCVEDLSVVRHRDRWDVARRAIASSPAYRAHPIDLRPQVGLVPIGKNPATGLWEFYDLGSAWNPSGEVDPATLTVPEHRADGSLALAADSGLVFVLVPGGTFRMGAQSKDAGAPLYDPDVPAEESPREVAVDPFFLARCEMSQAQWARLAYGERPSRYGKHAKYAIDDRHPVESISWTKADALMRHHGLALPSAAQWEYACRAGSESRWWTGSDRESLRSAGLVANFADAAAARVGAKWPDIADWPGFDDGFPLHAPVGSFRANPWGFSEMHGNVSEWCRDADVGGARVVRGGSFLATAATGASGRRYRGHPEHRAFAIGVRAARALIEE